MRNPFYVPGAAQTTGAVLDDDRNLMWVLDRLLHTHGVATVRAVFTEAIEREREDMQDPPSPEPAIEEELEPVEWDPSTGAGAVRPWWDTHETTPLEQRDPQAYMALVVRAHRPSSV